MSSNFQHTLTFRLAATPIWQAIFYFLIINIIFFIFLLLLQSSVSAYIIGLIFEQKLIILKISN